MELWQFIVALIQGLVEWLPISSEGQTVLFVYNFTSIPVEEIIPLVTWLHLATAIAVIVRYPRDFAQLLMLKDKTLFKLLLVATVATVLSAVPLYLLLKRAFTTIQGEVVNVLVGVLLLATAVILFLPTRAEQDITNRELNSRITTITGFLQGISILPGISRSGITISALLLQSVGKEKALKFSFLMSVPAVLGILVFNALTGEVIPPSIAVFDLFLMEIIVFLTGLGSMEILLRIARKIQFWKLCLLLGIIAVLFGLPALF